MNSAHFTNIDPESDLYSYQPEPSFPDHHPRLSATFPPAPSGSFRLFRIVSLYPIPTIELRIVSYPDPLHFQHDRHENQFLHNPLYPVTSNNNGGIDIYSHDHNGVSCPPYDAISYAWNPNATTDIASFSPPHVDATMQSNLSSPIFDQDHNTLPTQDLIVQFSQSAEPITIQITTHLLYGLLTAQELCSPTWLFVDAICIDQTDPYDKGVQVQEMDRVFRGARRVLIWLGMDLGPDPSTPVTNTSDRGPVRTTLAPSVYMGTCLERIPALVQILEAYLTAHQTNQEQEKAKSGDASAKHNAPDLPSSESGLWPALERLRLNPWFARLWVVQEIILANEVILLYGRHWLTWNTYAHLTALCEHIISGQFTQQHDSNLVNQLYFVYNSRISAMMKLQMAYRESIIGPITDPISDLGLDFESYSGHQDELNKPVGSETFQRLLLHLTRKSQCQLPVDRVYATLGLQPAPIRESIRVDYSPHVIEQPWAKWIEFCQTLLRFVPTIAEEIFSIAGYLDRNPDIPSWCPNLADASEKRGFFTADSKPTSAGVIIGSKPEQGLGPGIRSIAPISGTTRIMLQALALDTVSHVVDLSWLPGSIEWSKLSVTNSIEIDPDVASTILSTLWKCLEHVRTSSPTPINSDAADTILARVITANGYDTQIMTSVQLVRDYTAFTQWLEWNTWRLMSGGALKRPTRVAALRFADRVQRMGRRRALFVTHGGKAGLGSCRCAVGDTLVLARGLRVPYLIRRVDDTTSGDTIDDTGLNFELIGEAYVDGIMYGEGFRGRNMEKDGWQEFTIC